MEYLKLLFAGDSTMKLAPEMDVFVLFNASQSLGGLNYTLMGQQLDKNGFLLNKLLSAPLPLRLLQHPSLVLRFSGNEVLYRPRSTPSFQSWLSPRALEDMEPGEIYFFQVSIFLTFEYF